MDREATRPAHSYEEWMPTPASAEGDCTPEDQAQTQDAFRPLGHIHEGQTTMSPASDALEKAVGPSPGFRPNTPTASSTSCLSRSSTLNSSSTTESQESINTLYSLSSSSTDDTVSVSRSLTFPVVGSYPAGGDKSLSEGANIRLLQWPKSSVEYHPIFPYTSGVSAPMDQSSPGRMNRYPTWPKRRDEGSPTQNNQVTSPLRHLTFPLPISRDPNRPDSMPSFMFEGNEDRSAPHASSMQDQLPKDVTTSGTGMGYKVLRQNMPPDETGFHDLPDQTDSRIKCRLIEQTYLMFGPLDSKHDGLHCKLAQRPSTDFLAQRRERLSRNMSVVHRPKGGERGRDSSSKHHRADEDSERPNDTLYEAASTVFPSESAVGLGELRRTEHQTQTTDTQICHSPRLSVPNKPCGEGNRESSSQDSDDDASSPREESGPENEEDEDFAYDQLVESITNLVLESSCLGNIEERAVPVEFYVHSFLEQVVNHVKPANENPSPCLPTRNHPVQSSEAAGDAGDADPCGRGQGGNFGSSRRNKRKSNDAPGYGDNHDSGDENDLGGSGEEDQSENPQQVKKLKTGKNGRCFGCPFRKRNPIRFNIREHHSCATGSFPEFALVKRHVKNCHQKPKLSSCVRCKETFPDQAALRYHQTRPESCPLRECSRDEDPEEGITDEVERALKERAKSNSVGSWESLWELLFPQDPHERIPNPYYEPPVELDEAQNGCYDEEAARMFIHEQAIDGEKGMTGHGFEYMVGRFWKCRDTYSHERSRERLERDHRFVTMVHNELSMRQRAPQAQQPAPMVVCDLSQDATRAQWGASFENPFSLGTEAGLYDSHVPYPTFPIYASHLGVHDSQVSAPTALYPSSEGYAAYPPAGPQHAAATFPYVAMPPQGGSPCSAAGGSAHRSSGPSSQQSRDSGDHTQDTRDTQYTTQEQDAALEQQPHHHRRLGDGEEAGGPGSGAWSCSTPTGDMCAGVSGGASSDLTLCGVGSSAGVLGGASSDLALGDVGSSSSMRAAEFLDVYNSDEDLGPIPDLAN